MTDRTYGGRRVTLRGFAHIGAGTMVSRITGFVREIVTAAIFGAGTSMDIFVAAFTIPNLLCRILGETAVESAFMPLFKGLHAKGEKARAWVLARGIFRRLMIVLSVVVVVGIIIAPLLVRVVASGFTGDVADETVKMTRVMFPFGLFIGMAALMGAILLAFRRYRAYSLAPVLLNVGIVVSVLVLHSRIGYYSLAVGVLVGAALQFLVQVPLVRKLLQADRRGAPGAVSQADTHEDLKCVSGLSGPVIFAAAVQRVGVVVDRTIASFLVPGSISSLYYSFRLVHLPYAVLALAAGRSVAPVLAEQHALGQVREFKETLLSGIRMNVIYLVPVTLLSVWFARPVVGMVYQRGAFDETDLAMTASALAMYAAGLLSMGCVFLLTRAFAARLNTKTPVKVSLIAFALNVILNLLLVRTPLEHAGLALASSIAFTAHAVMLYIILNRTMTGNGAGIVPREIVSPAVAALTAGVVLIVVAWGLERAIGMRFAEETMSGRLVRVVVAGGGGLVAYLLTAWAQGLPEIRGLFAGRAGNRSDSG
jgi:putative peptidoglycan lipid II flippase